MLINLLILLALIVCSAFFSASEIAFLSLSNAKVATMVNRKLPRANLVEKVKNNQRKFLITVLIGNTLVNIAAGSLATVVVNKVWPNSAFGLATGLMTLLVLTFGEIFPKSFATNHPKQFAIFSVRFLLILEWLFSPLVLWFEWLTNLVAGRQQIEKVSAEEVQALATTSIKQGFFSQQEGLIMNRVFRFNDITAGEVMTKISEVICLQKDLILAEAVEQVRERRHSRFPVICGNYNEVVGVVHAKDLLLAYADNGPEERIIDYVLPIFSVLENLPIDQLLPKFQTEKSHMAMVKNNYGQIVGMVTLEDVLEELVGEIEDEYDTVDNP